MTFTLLLKSVLRNLKHVYYAIDETTRMRPSAEYQMCKVDQEFSIGGYTLPHGWQVIVNAANPHFMPEVFSDAYRFDPLRWSTERGEGKNPCVNVGFGGGMHK